MCNCEQCNAPEWMDSTCGDCVHCDNGDYENCPLVIDTWGYFDEPDYEPHDSVDEAIWWGGVDVRYY